MKLLLGILSCQRYSERRDAVRSTWLRGYTDQALFFAGKSESISNELVTLDCQDSYEHLPTKMLAFFRYSLQACDFDWLFKCDDDTYVDIAALTALIPILKADYLGVVCGHDKDFDRKYHIGKVSESRFNHDHRGAWHGPWCKGGDGYFLSRRAVEALARHAVPTDANELYEDKMVGDLLRDQGFVPQAITLPTCHPLEPKDMIAFHEARSNTMSLDALRISRAKFRCPGPLFI
jgi:hypothetical protein